MVRKAHITVLVLIYQGFLILLTQCQQLKPVSDTGFVVDIVDMITNRVRGNMKVLCNLTITGTTYDLFQNVSFLHSQ
jgi:hypothetical protein